MISLIARREAASLFRSPQAWLISGVLQFVFAWLFLLALEDYMGLQPTLQFEDHAPGITAFMAYRYMAPASSILLLIIPLLTMRTLSDEYRLNTYALLRSAPVSARAIVLGKFFGTLAFLLFLIGLIVLMPLCLAPVSGIDPATLGLAAIGLVVLAGAAAAIGVYFSSLTRHPLVAALCALATLLLLWLMGRGTFSTEQATELMSAVALSTHLGSFFQGLLDSRDVVYFLLITAWFLGLTVVRLDSQLHQRTEP